MEKNEAFRNQVLSRLYGIPDPTESAKEESSEAKSEDTKDKDKDKDEEKKDDKPVKEENTEDKSEKVIKDDKSEKKIKDDKGEKKIKEEKGEKDAKEEKGEKDAKEEKGEKETSEDKTDKEKEDGDEDKVKKDKDDVKTDHSNNNKDNSAVTKDNHDKSSNSSSRSNVTHTTPTTTTSHLYSVLMAPLDGRSPYREHTLRSASNSDHDSEASQRKRMRLDNSLEKVKSEHTTESGDHVDTKTTENTNSNVGMDLSKNQKKKLKKKKRKNLLNRIEVQRAKEFIYSSENEQYSVEKLRTMIEDVTEFLDAIWDVYCSEARLKGESVEEDGFKVAAVLKCLSASGEGSWGDLQLLSRAKSVLVLRSKNLAASTITRVENELGYDTDIRNFIVRMLKFWMDHVVTKA